MGEGAAVMDEEVEIDFVFAEGPVAFGEAFAVDWEFELFHCVVIGLELIIFRIILVILRFFAFFASHRPPSPHLHSRSTLSGQDLCVWVIDVAH